MVGNLLLRGMLCGLAAALVCFVFLRLFGEPPVDQAIAVEEAHAAAEAAAAPATAEPAGHHHGEEALVSRPTQAGVGLLTALVVYGSALGGLFSLAFAFCYGRWDRLGPRGTAALIAAVGFTAVYLVPWLKFPPSPPAVGNPDTIGERTAIYMTMVVLSLAGATAAMVLRGRLAPAHGRWNASLVAGGAYLAAMIAAAIVLPGIHEVPDDFPATTLWSFRMASLGGQAILWSVIGIGFGLLSHRVATRAPGARVDVAVV